MVKASDIVALIERYLTDKKLDHLEALYMWSRGISPTTTAPVLRNRYGTDVGYTTITDDLSNLKITSTSDTTEDTREPVNMAIVDIFRSKCVPELLDQIRENLKAINPRDKKLLLVLLRSGLFKKGDINLDELRLSYHALYGEMIDEFMLSQTIRELETIGILYSERTHYGEISRIKIPKYVYAILPEIEEKLPSVAITEG